jgi:hypothetical protein
MHPSKKFGEDLQKERPESVGVMVSESHKTYRPEGEKSGVSEKDPYAML